MGMAHRAPMDTYQPSYYVNPDVLAAARSRLGVTHAHRPDRDILNLVDALACEAVENEDVEHVLDATRGREPVSLVTLPGQLDGLVAFLKDNRGMKSRWSRTITQVVPKQLVEEDRLAGRWLHPSLATTGKLGTLGDKLGEQLTEIRKEVVAAPPPAPTPIPQPQEVPVTMPPVAAARPIAAVPPPAAAVETRLVSYIDQDEKTHYVEWPKSEAAARIAALVENDGIDPLDIRVWRPVVARIQVTLEE